MRASFRQILVVIIAINFAIVIAYLALSRSNGNPISRSTDKPLLTLFTTFKEVGMIAHHQLSFRIVVENWASFSPHVRPVVFLNFTNSTMADMARSAGWEVLQMERVNEHGTPHLVDMYRTAFQRFESHLYGYANGDLIFDHGLVRTLEAVCGRLPSLNDNVLMTGIRTNVIVDLAAEMLSMDQFLNGDRLKRLAEKRGKLFTPYSAEYFLVTRNGSSLQWSNLLDVVIGRGGYGTYLVAMAKSHGVNVIDTTSTVLAVHLSEQGIHSHGDRNPDWDYNRALIRQRHKNFDYRNGYPGNAKLQTRYDDKGTVQLIKRN